VKTIKLIVILIFIIGCSTDDDDYCACTKTIYKTVVENNHLTFKTISIEDVECQDESTGDLDGSKHYRIKCQ